MRVGSSLFEWWRFGSDLFIYKLTGICESFQEFRKWAWNIQVLLHRTSSVFVTLPSYHIRCFSSDITRCSSDWIKNKFLPCMHLCSSSSVCMRKNTSGWYVFFWLWVLYKTVSCLFRWHKMPPLPSFRLTIVKYTGFDYERNWWRHYHPRRSSLCFIRFSSKLYTSVQKVHFVDIMDRHVYD
jgi:hypothetical protein